MKGNRYISLIAKVDDNAACGVFPLSRAPITEGVGCFDESELKPG